MRINLVIKYIGKSLLLETAFMAISAVVSASNGLDDAFFPLLYSAVLTGIIGAYPSIFVRGRNDLSVEEGYYIVGLSWIFCCIFGSLPFLFYGITPTDSIFESVSGFTTTGASILRDIESLPQGLLFWRMSTAWIGGIGIIALFSLVLSSPMRNKNVLTRVESSEIAMSYSSGHRRSVIGSTLITYAALTSAAILLLKCAGMRWFDAVSHAMSAASTCGFGTRNNSLAAFGCPLQETILIVTMILASIRFELIGSMFRKGGIARIFRSEVTRTFLLMLAVGTLLTSIGLFRDGSHGSLAHCFRLAAFQVTSIFTTTGFATADTDTWPVACKSLIIAGSLVCGCSGSTSGGIKTDRFVTMIKGAGLTLQRINHPNRVTILRMDGQTINEGKMASILSFCFCYIAIIMAGAIAYCAMGIDLETSWTASIACMSNVGPGMGQAGSMSNYAFMPDMAKWVSVSLMMLGRLEIFPLLSIMTRHR